MSRSECSVWDFRYSEDVFRNHQELIALLKPITKKFVFQLEQGEQTGYRHYQGRLSFCKKCRKPVALKKFNGQPPNYLEPTCNPEFISGDAFYQQKPETRVDGPFTDKDVPVYIPKQIREIETLYPFQKEILSQLDHWDTRTINIVYCPTGNVGKSILCGYARAHQLARVLPPINDQKDMMRMVCDLPTAKAYIVDMPRSMPQDRLYGFFAAVETLKDGYAYDDRYHFKEKIFDCPNIWIFCNCLPHLSMLSHDRWKIWEISEKKELTPFKQLNM